MKQPITSAASRRQFLKTAVVLTGGLATAPSIVSAATLGREGKAPPSERITMGAIGIGGRGSFDLRCLVGEPEPVFVANCDVRADRRKSVKEVIDQYNGNKDCKSYMDFRELLARKDIDAVLIATSDRWHAALSIYAMKAGKDVYCEKPCSTDIGQGRALMETMKQYGRVFQAGTQRRSEEKFVFIIQLARQGYLGKLHTVTAHIRPGFAKHMWHPEEPLPAKEEVDWDMWLGPVPWHPYNSAYLKERGKHADTWTGGLGEWGAHTYDLCQWAADTVYTSPVEYIFPNNDTSEGLTAVYKNGIKLYNTANGFPGTCGVRFEGSEGKAECSDGHPPDVSQKSLLGLQKKIMAQYVAQSQRSLNHYRDFLDCVKNRRPANANAEVAHYAHTIVHAGTICMQLKRNLKWNPEKEEFIGDDEANRLRSRPVRDPWRI
jgi:predicted dehydrogenase